MSDLLNTKQAAEMLGLSAARVRQLAQRGFLRGQHVGRDWVFDSDHIRHFSTTRRKSGRPQNSRLLDRAIQDVDMWRNRALSQHAVIETLIEIGLPHRVGLIKKDGWYIGVIQEEPAP